MSKNSHQLKYYLRYCLINLRTFKCQVIVLMRTHINLRKSDFEKLLVTSLLCEIRISKLHVKQFITRTSHKYIYIYIVHEHDICENMTCVMSMSNNYRFYKIAFQSYKTQTKRKFNNCICFLFSKYERLTLHILR